MTFESLVYVKFHLPETEDTSENAIDYSVHPNYARYLAKEDLSLELGRLIEKTPDNQFKLAKLTMKHLYSLKISGWFDYFYFQEGHNIYNIERTEAIVNKQVQWKTLTLKQRYRLVLECYREFSVLCYRKGTLQTFVGDDYDVTNISPTIINFLENRLT